MIEMIYLLLGYMLIFSAVYYGRKDDSIIRAFTWQWALLILLVIAGTHLVTRGHQQSQKIQIEQTTESKNTQNT